MARNHSFDKMSHRGAACPISVTPRGEARRADRGSFGGAEEEENPMRFAVYLRSLAMMLGGLVVLSACTVVVEDEGPRPGPEGPDRDRATARANTSRSAPAATASGALSPIPAWPTAPATRSSAAASVAAKAAAVAATSRASAPGSTVRSVPSAAATIALSAMPARRTLRAGAWSAMASAELTGARPAHLPPPPPAREVAAVKPGVS